MTGMGKWATEIIDSEGHKQKNQQRYREVRTAEGTILLEDGR